MSYLVGWDHLVVNVAGFGAFRWKEFVVVVKVFDLPLVSKISKEGLEGGNYHNHPDRRGTVA